MDIDTSKKNWSDIRVKKFAENLYDGHFWQTKCKAREHLAIVIPFRDREEHLKVFINHIHPFLQSQLHDYGIYVIEQVL